MEARTPFWMAFAGSLGVAFAGFIYTGSVAPIVTWGLCCIAITYVQERKA